MNPFEEVHHLFGLSPQKTENLFQSLPQNNTEPTLHRVFHHRISRAASREKSQSTVLAETTPSVRLRASADWMNSGKRRPHPLCKPHKSARAGEGRLLDAAQAPLSLSLCSLKLSYHV